MGAFWRFYFGASRWRVFILILHVHGVPLATPAYPVYTFYIFTKLGIFRNSQCSAIISARGRGESLSALLWKTSRGSLFYMENFTGGAIRMEKFTGVVLLHVTALTRPQP